MCCVKIRGGSVVVILLVVFFFKQKTAYEMCGRDWSSDVCSSDLKYLGLQYIFDISLCYIQAGKILPRISGIVIRNAASLRKCYSLTTLEFLCFQYL